MVRLSSLWLIVLLMTVIAAAPLRADEPAAKPAGPLDKVLVWEPKEAPVVPRCLRWAPREVHYLRANVRHPTLYYRSVQESIKHDDARMDNLPGAVAAETYEVVRTPVQFVLTPLWLVLRPPWLYEHTEP